MGWADAEFGTPKKDGQWTIDEIDVLSKAMTKMRDEKGKVNQRGLAQQLVDAKSLPHRTYAAIYIRIRAAVKSGEADNWFSNKPIGHSLI